VIRPTCLALLAALALPVSAVGQGDPVRSDPPAGLAHPPGMEELKIPSGGTMMNGFIYLAAGAGAHPTAVFLHGYPGNERNLDLAQAVRRAGWNALYFDYRGSWGSGGTFSYGNALDDVAAALAFLRSPDARTKYGVDAGRIALVGHSFGGGLALLAEARDARVACAVSLAGFNAGAAGREPRMREGLLGYFRATMDPASGPIHADADQAIAELQAHAAEWDLVSLAPALKNRPVLLVAGTRDPENNATRRALTDALHAAGATHLRSVEWNDDHPFSAHRLALSDLLVRWLGAECPAPRG
jgi:pimeloyl-ACP methyl ester carboxylesterase